MHLGQTALRLGFHRALAVASAVLSILVSASSANAYDAAGEFDPNKNPSALGPWSYGYQNALGGPLILYTERGTSSGIDFWRYDISGGAPAVTHNPGGSLIAIGTVRWPAGQLSFHPGPGNQISVVRFTVPSAGAYDVVASFSGLDVATTTTDVHVLVNDVSIFDGLVISAFTSMPGSGPTFDSSVLSLQAGDTVDFAVGFGTNGNYVFDSTGLSATIRLVVADTDGDGVPDDSDICPGGDDHRDGDADGVPDFCDPCPSDGENDADGDGVCGDLDVCPAGDDAVNTDGDGLPDSCDACPADPQNDADGDGFCESSDNCPLLANSEQNDTDEDAEGDACDADDDGDGQPDETDNCPLDSNADQLDTDQDSEGDACDIDRDGDGVVDAEDVCVPTPLGEAVDAGGCSISDLCPCDNAWKNHGAYVSCVAHRAEDFVAAGLITDTEKDAIVSAAGQSVCGQKK